MPIFLFLCLFSNTIFADQIICPSVSDIKHHSFNSWIPLYIEGEELASIQDIEHFKQQLSEFRVAKWDKDYLESAHCFYQGSDPILNKIVFAQDAWRPATNNFWSWIRPNAHAECQAMTVEDCPFIP